MFVVIDVAVVVIVLFLLVLDIIDVDTLMMMFIICITPPPIQPSPTTQQPAQNHRLCNVLRVTCHVLRVTCYVLRVTCYVLNVTHLIRVSCLIAQHPTFYVLTAATTLIFAPNFRMEEFLRAAHRHVERGIGVQVRVFGLSGCGLGCIYGVGVKGLGGFKV